MSVETLKFHYQLCGFFNFCLIFFILRKIQYMYDVKQHEKLEYIDIKVI